MTQLTETTVLGRIREEIDIEGRKCWTVFDADRLHSFITSRAAGNEHRTRLRHPHHTLLTGTRRPIREIGLVMANVEGHAVDFMAHVVDEIGRDDNGREIDVLFGSLAMKQWDIKPDVANGRLDFTHYTKAFVEFLAH